MPSLSNWESETAGRGAKKSDLRGSATKYPATSVRFERPQFMDESMDNSDYYEASIYDGKVEFWFFQLF